MKLIIIDRDGVINQDSKEYIKNEHEWLPIPGSLEAIAKLHQNGFTVVVATNQSGIARGLFSQSALQSIHQKMEDAVKQKGGHIDGIFYCPHGPDDNCDCRKPKPGLLQQIAKHYGISLNQVPYVGDSYRDLEAAIHAGATPVLVLTGNGQKTLTNHAQSLQKIAYYDDLLSFAHSLVSK